MTTLRIEHAITEYDTWKAAFDRFADARQQAGVRGFTIRQPVADPHFLMLDLEFDSTPAAEGFAAFLHERVWSTPTASPGLAGTPRTQVLDLVERVGS